MAGTQLLKRIPRIKFPQRHPKPSGPDPVQNRQQALSGSGSQNAYFLSSEVPAPPQNTAFGGKASLQPKRTPVSEHEIEAILSGGCS